MHDETRNRLQGIGQWIQAQDDALLYTPDPDEPRHPHWMGHYILEGHTPVPVDDVLLWGRWFATADRQVALTTLADGTQVSTVFLGLDHSLRPLGPPLLFETMVFRDGRDEAYDRYSTWEEAVAGHAAMCTRVSREALRHCNSGAPGPE